MSMNEWISQYYSVVTDLQNHVFAALASDVSGLHKNAGTYAGSADFRGHGLTFFTI
jgi:hypothetical protein